MTFTHAQYLAHEAKLKARTLDAPAGEGCADESKLHDQIIAELNRRRYYFVHSRMDRATTQRKGVPDFIVAIPGTLNTTPRTLWVEAKRKGGKLTPEQAGALAWLDRDGHETAVVYSLDGFLKAIEPNTEMSEPERDNPRS